MKQRNRRVGLREVSALAGVSVFTASKVLNGDWNGARISDECATRVRAAARELGYEANFHAQMLTRGRTSTVGLVLREPQHNDPDFAAALMLGIEAQLALHQHDLLLIGRRGEETELERGRRCLGQGRIDALIVPGCLGGELWSDAFDADEGVVVLATAKPGSPHPAVDVDASPGIDAAVAHLHQLGHRSILWLTPEDGEAGGDPAIAARRAAFAAATAAHGVTGDIAAFPMPAGPRGTDQRCELTRGRFAALLRRGLGSSAVMCYNDVMAIGACRAAHDAGVRVPRDLSIIGFDDFRGSLSIPRLTTISHELAGIGARAAELAMAMAQDAALHRRLRGQVELLPARLVVRESTAPPRSEGAP